MAIIYHMGQVFPGTSYENRTRLTPVSSRGSCCLYQVLARITLGHEYVSLTQSTVGVSTSTTAGSSLPLSVHLGRVPAVLCVPNLLPALPAPLHPLRRIVALRLCRQALQQAAGLSRSALPATRGCGQRHRPFEIGRCDAARGPRCHRENRRFKAELEHAA